MSVMKYSFSKISIVRLSFRQLPALQVDDINCPTRRESWVALRFAGEPSRLLSTGSQRVGHDWSDLACTHALPSSRASLTSAGWASVSAASQFNLSILLLSLLTEIVPASTSQYISCIQNCLRICFPGNLMQTSS